MKKITILTVLLLVLITATTCFASSDNVKVYLDDKLLEFDVQPMIVDGRTMVPMRKIFEELGAEVQWDGETKTITGTRSDTTIIMQLNNNVMKIGETIITLDVAPFEAGGRTLVPVRAIAESFGVNVKWDPSTKSVIIDGSEIKNENKLNNVKDTLTSVFTPNMSDVSMGSIKTPFYPSDTLDSKYSQYFPLNYDSSIDSDNKKIYIYINNTIGGSNAKNEIAEYKVIKEKCKDDQAWRIYDIELVYSNGIDELEINELITIDNIFNEYGTKYIVDASYLIVRGKAYKDGECTETLSSGNSVKVRLALLTDKNPGFPLLAIKYSNGNAAKYIHIVSSKVRETDSSIGNKNNPTYSTNTNMYNDYGAFYAGSTVPTYTSVTGISLKRKDYTNKGYAVYCYDDTQIGEYSEMADYISFLMSAGWVQTTKEKSDDILIYGYSKNRETVLVSFVYLPTGWEVWISPNRY